jgi:hypothetical protein
MDEGDPTGSGMKFTSPTNYPSQQQQQNVQGPTISVINYNNRTLNMNFNDLSLNFISQ